MTAHRSPRPGSRVDDALQALYRSGGAAALHPWIRAAQWTRSTNSFSEDVVSALILVDMVYIDGEIYRITRAGLDYLEAPLLDAPASQPAVQPVVAGPRYVAPRKPLSAKHMVRVTETRPGALDYRDVPSRMGDTRLAHGTKAKA